MTEPVIVFDKVTKIYPLYHHMTGGLKNFLFHLPRALSTLKNSKFEALRNVSFTVAKGEALGIIGRNGAGKSTTLGLIAGVLKPTEGRVTVKGKISPFLELGASFHPDLTGAENIVLNGVLLGMTRSQIRKKTDEIIEFSEIGDFIEQPIRIYSSGMLARLGFSVVAHLDPDILLIDEILQAGDMEFQKKCFQRMWEFRKNGVTMVLVTHSMESVKTLCDRVIWFDQRTIRMDGNPQDVVALYKSSAGVNP
jgi:homopolymeric O-antigen transport system ATP-binding protein